MHDLDTRLERLAAEATRDAVPPEPETVARRGRWRRRRRFAGPALVVAAAVAAGLVLPARLAGRPGPAPAAAPATDVSGAGMITGHWFGRADAAVFLDDVDPARRQAIRERVQALDVVDQVFFETREEAYERVKVLYRNRPELMRNLDPAALPESFRVRLDDPRHFQRLFLALCRPGAEASGRQQCIPGVDGVFESQAALKPLIGKPWLIRGGLTVFLPEGTTAAQREAVRARLEAIDGVTRVVYETPEQAYRRLPEKFRQPVDKRPPVLGPEAMHGSFRVILGDPTRVDRFHRTLCGSRTTGACPFGLVLVDHRPLKDQAGAGAGTVRVRP